jgi:polysaccharide chain length determinant protein (PEP-CTERM system associated)
LLEQVELVLSGVRSMWRFRYGAMLVAWLVCLLGWAFVFILPPKYETRARVYLDPNSLLRPLLQGLAVPPNTASQIEMVRGVLLARPQLQSVIDETPLRRRIHKVADRDVMITHLAKSILIQGEGRGENSDRAPAFYSISFRDSDPKVSLAVVDRLLKSFVSESLGANQTSTETAQKFLSDQLNEYEQKLSASERELAEFKRQNLGAMPDERGGYFSRLQTEMTELDRLRSQLSVLVVRRNDLRFKLVGGPAQPDSAQQAPMSLETSVDAPLAAAKAKLVDLLLRFTDRHPDVIAARETISQLEAQRKQELDSMRSNHGALGETRATTSLVTQNLQIALNQSEVEIAGLQSQIAERQKRVEELRQSINTVPEVERDLARLTRNYNVTKVQYDTLLQRLESARLSGQADKTDERKIRIVEPPFTPRDPVSPNTLVLLLAVLAGGIGAGAGYAHLKSRINPVFSSTVQLSQALNLPVLGAIDRIARREDALSRRVQTAVFGLLAASLFAAFIAVILFSRFGQQGGAVVRGALLGS